MKNMQEIHAFSELEEQLERHDRLYLLLYKKGNESSDCAYANIREAAGSTEDVNLLFADVNRVRDIHPRYDITSAPSLLEFRDSELKNVIRGCNDNGHYKHVFQHTERKSAGDTSAGRPAKRVTVYSTPACSWCNTLKRYLREHHIPFRDTDVSRDMRAAGEMVARSGQRGVPQTDINGKIIVGFDKERLNTLLEIKG